jgi:ribosomal protein S18 acetylase RimI-like enzyme
MPATEIGMAWILASSVARLIIEPTGEISFGHVGPSPFPASLPIFPTKGWRVVHYRTFRNDDPPRVVELWNQVFQGRGAVELPGTTLLEYHVFAKPYFDREGFIFAFDSDRAVGFVHAGFGATETESALNPELGVICAVGVLPGYRRQGIGTQLVRRAEEYLQSRGAKEFYVGASPRRNPFYVGLYGGSSSSGILASDPTADPFLTRLGYQPEEIHQALQRRLDTPFNLTDGRFPGLRRKFEIRIVPRVGAASWWQECILGPLELVEFRLEEKLTGKAVAVASAWDMDTYSQRWREAAVGLIHIEVLPELRRQGLAKFLMDQLIRHLQDQCFLRTEVVTTPDDVPINCLLTGLGFQQVDLGHAYHKAQTTL